MDALVHDPKPEKQISVFNTLMRAKSEESLLFLQDEATNDTERIGKWFIIYPAQLREQTYTYLDEEMPVVCASTKEF